MANTKASGSFRFTCEVSGSIALSRITAGWTDDEVRALLDNDEEAVEEAVSRAQREFGDELEWETGRTSVAGKIVSCACHARPGAPCVCPPVSATDRDKPWASDATAR